MSVEAERFDPDRFAPPWTRSEHMQRFAFAADYVRGHRVVDCACGAGIGSRQFIDSGATSVLAVDLSHQAAATTANASAGLPVFSICADAVALPLPAGSADVFVSFETFEHLPEPERLLDEACRVLRPGGLLICSTPNRIVYSPGHEQTSIPWNKFHMREYTHEEFARALTGRFSKCEFFGQNPMPQRLATRIHELARYVPADLVVRLKQLAKLPRLVRDRHDRYRVQPARAGLTFEISVAVCAR